MQRIIYDECPYIATVYPQSREVYDSEHWTEWTRMPAVTGGVDNRWTFINVESKPDTTAGDESGAKGIVIAAVIFAVIVAGVVVWLLIRRRTAKLELD
jgi:hypothetical protein